MRRTISQRSEMIYDAHNFGIILDSREIFLSSDQDYNSEEAMIDHRAANTFIKNLQILNEINDNTILIHMCTVGGEWDYGIAIFDAIKTSSSDCIILTHAHARSMSSIIPQAAKWRIMMPNACFKIHWGSDTVSGNCTSVYAEVDWSKKLCERMLDIYAERCKDGQFFKREGLDFKQIREWLREKITMKQEYYLTAREAVDKGFMDAVLGDDEFEDIKSLRDEE